MAKIFLRNASETKLYYEKIKEASTGLGDERTIASIGFVRTNLEFRPDIVVCFTGYLSDAIYEMSRRGASKTVHFSEDVDALRKSFR